MIKNINCRFKPIIKTVMAQSVDGLDNKINDFIETLEQKEYSYMIEDIKYQQSVVQVHHNMREKMFFTAMIIYFEV